MTAGSAAAIAAGTAQAALPVVDPFGLWQPPLFTTASPPPATGETEGLSFGLPGGGGPGPAPEEPSAVWTLPLINSGAAGGPSGEQELERRAGQIQAINQGLDEAAARVEAFLVTRARQQENAGAMSFSVEPAPTPMFAPEAGAPELDLAYALDSLAGAEKLAEAKETASPEEQVSFGMGEEAVQAARQAAQQALINWEDLCQRANALFDGLNRQLLHFAWVDTTLDGLLVARTTVNWGGDVITFWQPGLPPAQCSAHCRSLDLAIASRAANLRTILTVSQIAGKIVLAVSTPLGAAQALALGWQFVSQVVMPLLKQVG